ncbi:MAG: DUF1512 family protein, partial [Candidatus Aenigmatarchaeota archaeon]
KLENDVKKFEIIASSSRDYVIKSISKTSNSELKRKITEFLDFFSVEPVSLDPYGIVKKLDMIIRLSDKKFNYFVKQILPTASLEKQNNIKNALMGAITIHQLAKIVRHNFEIIKKYKLYQLAIILQMQLPLIERIANSVKKATMAFADGKAIGDGIGPLVAATMISGNPEIMKEEEFVYYKTKMFGKNVIISKALGPGASTGQPGKFLLKLSKNIKINRIITIDAGLRLEGEKPGSIAEGVGVAMGGSGVERYEIEEFAVSNNIPLDAVVIKVSDEEALQPMKLEIVNAVEKAKERVEKLIRQAEKNENILIIGVGNTCGIENNKDKADESIKKILNEIKKEKQKEKQT